MRDIQVKFAAGHRERHRAHLPSRWTRNVWRARTHLPSAPNQSTRARIEVAAAAIRRMRLVSIEVCAIYRFDLCYAAQTKCAKNAPRCRQWFTIHAAQHMVRGARDYISMHRSIAFRICQHVTATCI